MHANLRGDDPLEQDSPPRARPEFLAIVLAIGVFLWLASLAQRPLVSLGWLDDAFRGDTRHARRQRFSPVASHAVFLDVMRSVISI